MKVQKRTREARRSPADPESLVFPVCWEDDVMQLKCVARGSSSGVRGVVHVF